MIPLRICLAGAAAVLALGGGTALAAPALMGSVSHGDKVSAAAQSCSKGAGDAHGDCVNAVAEKETTHSTSAHGQSGSESAGGSESSSSNNDAHGDAVSAAAKSCAHGTASNRDAHGDCVSAVAKTRPSPSPRAGGH